MDTEKPVRHKRKRQTFFIVVSLFLAVVVLASAIWLRKTDYFHSGESHFLEAIQGLHGGTGIVSSPEDGENLKRRQLLFQEGSAQNTDMAAWLVLPDTMIDYPVMGGTDSEKYRNHSWDGSEDLYGTPFLDSRNAVDFTDYFSLICAHDMNNNTMFSGLHAYQDADYFQSAQDGVLILSDGMYRLTPVASFSASAPVTVLVHQLLTVEEEKTFQLEQLMKAAAVQKHEYTITENDRWVMLSTLDYADSENENGLPAMLLLKLEAL